MTDTQELVAELREQMRRAAKLSDDAMTNEDWDDLDTHVSAFSDMSSRFAEAAAAIESLDALRIEALEAKLDALVKAAEPFAIAAEQVRVGYASRYSDKDLGFANFDKMPDHWPVERCVFTMGDFRALSHALKQAKDAP